MDNNFLNYSTLFSLYPLFDWSSLGYSQDTIQFKNSDPIEVDILKVSNEKLEYRLSNYEDGPVIEVDRDDLVYISFNGKVFYTTEEQNVAEESGSIMRERRHYFALGVPIGMSSSKNTRSLRLFFLENKNCIWDLPQGLMI